MGAIGLEGVIAIGAVIGACILASLYTLSAGLRDFQRISRLKEEVEFLRADYNQRIAAMTARGEFSGDEDAIEV